MKRKIFDNNHLIQIWLTKLRDKNTPSAEINNVLNNILYLMGGEIFNNIGLKSNPVETPIAPFLEGVTFRDSYFLVFIMRAALSLTQPLVNLLPTARIIHIGMERLAFEWKCYYNGLAKQIEKKIIQKSELTALDVKFYIVDIMIATGNSLFAVIDLLKGTGISEKNIIVIGIIASEFAVNLIEKKYPQIKMFLGSVDRALDDKNYIVPGMGDAGDRIFNTSKKS